MELAERIETSFGTGPEHPSIEHRIAAGRRALRRRRVGVALAGVGVVAALGTTYAVLGPDAQRGATGEVVVEPTPTPTSESVPWPASVPVRYLDGELQVRPGVVVHEHLDNPYRLALPNRSDALDITFEGQRIWTIVELTDGQNRSSSSVPDDEYASFTEWVVDQAGSGADADGWPDTLRLTEDGAVVASEGSEVLQRTDDPQLGDAFAAPGTPTGAAVVRAGEDGVAYFVVWRVQGGELEVFTTPPRDVVGATFEELLTAARGRYASGEGSR